MLGTAQLRQVLAKELRDGHIRTTRRNSDQTPTHTTLDRLWMVESETLLRLERAYVSDVGAGTGVYMAEFHPPRFALHLHFLFMGGGPTPIHARAVAKLCAELSLHAAAPMAEAVGLISVEEAGQWGVRLHFPGWLVNEIMALRLQAFALAWLRHTFPTLLAPRSAVNPDAYRRPVPWLACPDMVVCSACRRATSKMEHCAPCGMTGWTQLPCSRMRPWHAWSLEKDVELSDVTAELLQKLRLSCTVSAELAFENLPAATPPLPLWQCQCAAPAAERWHSQRSPACAACGARFQWRTARMRWPKDDDQLECSVCPPRHAVLLQPHDVNLLLLRGAFRSILWMVGGGGDVSKCNPWRHCTMGLAWRVSEKEYVVALRGLGSSTHPVGVCHPHAPLFLRITPEGGAITCSAPGCAFTTGMRPLANMTQLFAKTTGAQVPIGRHQWEHQGTRVAWLQCVVERYRNGLK